MWSCGRAWGENDWGAMDGLGEWRGGGGGRLGRRHVYSHQRFDSVNIHLTITSPTLALPHALQSPTPLRNVNTIDNTRSLTDTLFL